MSTKHHSKREFDLSTFVKDNEAAYFVTVTESFNEISDGLSSVLVDDVLSRITTESVKCFGHKTTTEICGSVLKGTNVSGSDIDFYVHTEIPCTLEQRKCFEKLLKNVFSDAHVSLGKKAIHVCTAIVEVDVVCSNTADSAVIHRPDITLISNKQAQLAIRALKSLIKSQRAQKVPGHMIESLVKTVQEAYPIEHVVGGGAMQLFISVLQNIADSEGPSIFGLPGGSGAASHLKQIVKSVLHLFVVSRVINGSFRSLSEMGGGFLRNSVGWNVQSDVGPIPTWLLANNGMPPPDSPDRSIFERYGTVGRENMDNTVRALPHSLKLFSIGPLGNYTLFQSKINVGVVHPVADVERLRVLANGGSTVAQQMFETRVLWYMGLEFLHGKEAYKIAVKYFGASIRGSVYNGDPFSGAIELSELNSYMKCARSVLDDEPNNVDAMLFRISIFLNTQKWTEALSECERAARFAPDDAYGALHRYCLVLSNMGRWKDAFPIAQRCVNLFPEEPIFHYWVGTVRRQLFDLYKDFSTIPLMIKSYETFLSLASPEGRKFCQALYEVAYLRFLYEMHRNSSNRSNGSLKDSMRNKFIADVRTAQKAEAKRLSWFPPSDFDAKSTCASMMTMFNVVISEESNDEIEKTLYRADVLKQQGNDAMKQQQYETAIGLYTACLECKPNVAEVYSNRAAAHYKLEHFVAALTDCESASLVRPEWAKPHYRAALAHIGRKDVPSAQRSAALALALSPNDENVLALTKLIADLEVELAARPAFTSHPREFRLAPCWNSIMFKDNVMTVDLHGRGDFVNLADALCYARNNSMEGISIILTIGKHVTKSVQLYRDKLSQATSINVQLIGWNDSVADKNNSTRLELLDVPKSSTTSVVDNESFFILSASGEHVALHIQSLVLVQPVGLPRTCVGSCALCADSAIVNITKCTLSTPNSPCVGVHGINSVLTLMECKVKKSSAVAVCAGSGLFRTFKSDFQDCNKVGVDIRDSGSSAELTDCSFRGCAAHAVSVNGNGHKLTMTRCKISKCGSRMHHAAIHLECGQTLLKDCVISNCPGDGIVLQDRINVTDCPEPPPQLVMQSCTLEANVSGCNMYAGYGTFSKNMFQNNASIGLLVTKVKIIVFFLFCV
jgi:tetratricopeptide (TPR) repeat protein